MSKGDMQGESAGGFHAMSERMQADRTHIARRLTASEIRSRVEIIAEELAWKMRAEEPASKPSDLEAYPLDTRKFVLLMSEFVRMN